MWIVFSLSAAFSFALVHILDEYCVGEIFEKPWFGVITSSIASIIVFQLIPFIGPFVDWTMPPMHIFLMAFCAGILIQISQGLYFKSLSYSEAGIVAAYWNLIPAFLPFVSFLVLGNLFSISEITGIAVLIMGSVTLCLLDSNFETRWKSFFLMFVASLLQVCAYLLEDIVFEQSAFFPAFYTITLGIIITGMIPLLLPKIRKAIHRNSKRLTPVIKFFLLIEFCNLLALFFAQKGIATGDVALVAAVETTMPAHIFIISALLVVILPKIAYKEVLNKLPQKMAVVILMILGVYLVS